MLCVPQIIVNCDGCPRHHGFTTWDSKATLIEQLERAGWAVLPAKPGGLEPAFCPECAAKKK